MNIHSNNRRQFLKTTLAGSAVISLSGAVPGFLLGASRPVQQNSQETIMVVIQLSGGNDGLNTVVPYGDDEYYKNRFTLAIGKQNVLKVDDHIGLHPAMTGLNELLQDERLSIVQGVGYPNPNRSHFESMDLWHTAHQVNDTPQLGWLGRSVDTQMAANPLPAVHLGRGLQPLALKTERQPIPSIRSIDNFKLTGLRDKQSRERLAGLIRGPRKTENSLLSYIHQSADVALETSHKLEGISKSQAGEFNYPGTELGRNLGVIAKLIGSGLSTRIYYTTLDGFDTHSNQIDAHQSLLADFSNSIAAFTKQMEAQGNSQRVVTLAFSEFGRRVRENASRGTDHGTAAPVFVCGSAVKQPIVGKHPSLKDLDQGDLKYKIDYRTVYADLLENWLGVDSAPIVGGKFKPAGIFNS